MTRYERFIDQAVHGLLWLVDRRLPAYQRAPALRGRDAVVRHYEGVLAAKDEELRIYRYLLRNRFRQ